MISFQNNLELFRADKSSPAWNGYIDYIDELVLDALFNAVHCSLAFFLTHTDSTLLAEGASMLSYVWCLFGVFVGGQCIKSKSSL